MYSFVLTDVNGRRRYGFCQRFFTNKEQNPIPECVCFLSFLPWFELFDNLLSIAVPLLQLNQTLLIEWLQMLYELPLPEPNIELAVPVPSQLEELSFVDDDGYFYLSPPGQWTSMPYGVDLSALILNLDPNLIVSLMATLLVERRVIFTSSNLATLSSGVMAAYSLLNPFSWEQIFIPVLPEEYLNYCCAPMPFLVGVQAHLLSILETLPLEEVIFVDLDNNYLEVPESQHAKLPKPYRNNLQSALAKIVDQTNKTSNFDNQAVVNAFVALYVGIFGSYRKYLLIKENGEYYFDLDSFENTQPKGVRNFIKAFRLSQLSERFITEREVMIKFGSQPFGSFEKEINILED